MDSERLEEIGRSISPVHSLIWEIDGRRRTEAYVDDIEWLISEVERLAALQSHQRERSK